VKTFEQWTEINWLEIENLSFQLIDTGSMLCAQVLYLLILFTGNAWNPSPTDVCATLWSPSIATHSGTSNSQVIEVPLQFLGNEIQVNIIYGM